MGKNIDEMIKEVMSDKALLSELMAAMNEPAQVAAFLKVHGCGENVNEFIKRLDSFNE
ncbi:MAG: hypothetical protein K5876_04060 [Ruminiclostridium sp.]|nr:hypothetical protein [Ruminiclostridium sp.]